MDEMKILRAIYETQRTQILLTYLTHPESEIYPDSFIFATAERMQPTLQHQDSKYIDPFEGVYDISKDTIHTVLKFCDGIWGEGKTIGFRELMDHFKGITDGDNRLVLRDILRYAFLDNQFDGEEFWKNLQAYAPIECKPLDRELSENEIRNYLL